uniref:Immunoglobulin V-set domain-containing protein n=1 Tax=Astyanax mexicanus TaxID=7994 RepID=A0A3B1KKP1_ASTMX
MVVLLRNLKIASFLCQFFSFLIVAGRVMIGYEGDVVQIRCPYASNYKQHLKHFCKENEEEECLTEQNEVKVSSERNRRGRFSLSDDTSSGIFTVSITDLREEDSGTYWCGEESSGSAIYTKVHLLSPAQSFVPSPVQSFLPSTVQSPVQSSSLFSVHSPVQSTSFMLSPLFSKQNFWVYVLISIICLYFFLIYSQVPPVVCVYEEIKPTKHLPDSDTGVYANASTLTPPKDQDLTYSTVSFHKNPGSPTDSSVSVNKEETETEYATVKRPKEPDGKHSKTKSPPGKNQEQPLSTKLISNTVTTTSQPLNNTIATA